ncbi:hypothetical protein J0S82_016454, partial [Galemys pyrenaicus]
NSTPTKGKVMTSTHKSEEDLEEATGSMFIVATENSADVNLMFSRNRAVCCHHRSHPIMVPKHIWWLLTPQLSASLSQRHLTLPASMTVGNTTFLCALWCLPCLKQHEAPSVCLMSNTHGRAFLISTSTEILKGAEKNEKASAAKAMTEEEFQAEWVS